jgi:hypothetical protein
MLQVVQFISSHIAMLGVCFALASILAAALDAAARILAPAAPRVSHVLAAIARLLPQVINALMHIAAMLTGRALTVTTLEPYGTTVAEPSKPGQSGR